MTTRLRVLLYGDEIGHLAEGPGGARFQLHPRYWADPKRAVLGQWFEDAPEEGPFEGLGGRLPPFFANLEPEGPLLRWLAHKHDLGTGVLGVLRVAGFDLPGAVQVLPYDDVPGAALQAVQPFPGPVDAFSAPGVQLKLPMSLDKDDRLTLPGAGELGDWMLKVPGPRRYRGIAQNEHATMTWARLAGFDVPLTRLAEPPEGVLGEDDLPRTSLLVRRFDRTTHGAVHQEDLCQVLGLDPGQKYPRAQGDPAFDDASETVRAGATTAQGVGRVAARMLGHAGAMEYLRRFLLVVATGNGDAHLKNWAVWYPDRRHAQWSLLYDQVSTIAWDLEELVLPLFGVRSFAKVHLDDVVRLGAVCGVSATSTRALADEVLARLAAAWPEVLERAPYPDHHGQLVRHHWAKRVPLLSEGPALR